MIRSGRPRNQAVAASLSNARRHPRASGGSNIPEFPAGTFPQASVSTLLKKLPHGGHIKLPPSPAEMGYVASAAPSPTPNVPQYGDDLGDTLRQYDTPEGQAYLNVRSWGPTSNSRRHGGRLTRADGGPTVSPYVANVPVGGTSGAVSSPYVAQIGSNGLPVGTTAQSGFSGNLPSTTTAPGALTPKASSPSTTSIAPNMTMQQILGTNWQSPEIAKYAENYGQNPNNNAVTQNSTFSSLSPDFQKMIQSYVDQNGLQGRKSGGRTRLAIGGLPSLSGGVNAAVGREELHRGGLFGGTAGGRTDTLPVSVAADSHVVPADVVSGLGQGNTLNGAGVLAKMFHSGPHGMPLQHGHAALHVPHPHVPQFSASGGRQSDGGDKTVPIAASSGEFNIKPEAVYAKGLEMAKKLKLDPRKLTPRHVMDMGHDFIDEFIVHSRKQIIAKMARLPKPRKD